jgi:DNA-directed RNA polymerase subunit alpha
LIGPLKPGQSIIYGTTLRRLLMNLQSPTISSVSIKNLIHEFDTFKGLKESSHEIITNLEQIVIGYTVSKKNSKNYQILHVQFQGPGVLTSKDLNLKPPFQIIDQNQYIATLEASIGLDMILTIEASSEYDLKNSFSLPVTTFTLRNRNPIVTNVNINLLPIDNKKSECLLLEIWTNGSMKPSEALRQSSQVASLFFYQLGS